MCGQLGIGQQRVQCDARLADLPWACLRLALGELLSPDSPGRRGEGRREHGQHHPVGHRGGRPTHRPGRARQRLFPGCERPLAWCEAHHLRHWLHGGPTDLANLALLCRAIIGRSMRGLAAGPPG
jgi:hypothetical protein